MNGHNYYVYILTNENNTVLYTGVTRDLIRRLDEHKKGVGSRFTKKYNLHKLVYFEHFYRIETAIDREKQIKAGSKAKKSCLD
ncbi:GIY-YIG nuclease family protein [Desulfonatronovibrio magnus]|uniref:GIY-YIG nuclease family protein n=1 Tax=Desulfonatronovibrio magnus TaxID=698827 RepID=UPI0018DD9E5B|nr:GIY-YIG nuclease family protein [Desulfonatronovibrio magnus]